MKQFFQDGDGAYSSTRLAFIATVFIVLGVWAYVSIAGKTVADIPTGLASVIFTFMAGKVGQTWIERKPGG